MSMKCGALTAVEPVARSVFKGRLNAEGAEGAEGRREDSGQGAAGAAAGGEKSGGWNHFVEPTAMVEELDVKRVTDPGALMLDAARLVIGGPGGRLPFMRREAARPAGLRRWGFPEGMEVREAAGAPTQIVGYAAVFGVEAHGEVIRKGAFKKSLAGARDVRAYWQHDTRFPLGRQSNGTLKLKEDGRGLWCEITPNPETTWGRDALAAVGRGDVQGMSFGFVPVTASEKVVQGKRVTVLEEVDLYEVSAVSEPWYEATTAEARDFNAEGAGLNAEGAEGAEGRREEGEGQGAAGAAAGEKEKTEEAARAAAAGASASRAARLRALKVWVLGNR